jgi:hypothetical protein
VVDEGDGWGPGVQEVEDLSGLSAGDDLTAAVSFSQVLVSYPDVWYAILQPNFASVRIRLSVNTAPAGVGLALTITDGIELYSALIPAGQTSAILTINGYGDTPFADTTRELSVTAWEGGGYRASSGEALDTSATQNFAIKAYYANINLLQPGIWLYDEGTWSWAGPAETGDFEWSEEDQQWDWTGTNADWDWDASNQRWAYVGAAVTGWSWLAAAQRWLRTLPAADAAEKPDGPPSGPVSPLPTETPSSSDSYTVVAQAEVDKPPLPNSANDLSIQIVDMPEDQSEFIEAGMLEIPAVSMMFGSWKWNPATSEWEYPTPPAGWAWTGDAWEWRGTDADEWSWDTANEEWTGPVGGTAPNAGPPTQNSSTFPPDGERWEYDGGEWTGTAQAIDGSAPDFTGLLVGRLTYHMPLSGS